MVVEIYLTKHLERKKKEQTKGRTNRRMPICNPTIQLVFLDLYTKYEVSILNGCGDIFNEEVLRNYGRTDGRTDRCKPAYPPLFQSGGIKKNLFAWYAKLTNTCTSLTHSSSRSGMCNRSILFNTYFWRLLHVGDI